MSETAGKDLSQFLGSQMQHFEKTNNWGLKWEEECLFARQQILKQDFTLKTAMGNPASLQAAILNVSAIGISLNPATAHAYLVPRDRAICLDISYKGLVKLATDCGAVKDCKTVLVYESDTFEWNGPYEMPSHKADVFAEDRGEVKGAYNIAYLPDGRVMVDTMSRKELDKIKATSKASNGPWKTWPEEMMKKSMTKRASKSWPQTEHRERFDRAVEALHESEGLAFTGEQQAKYMELLRADDPVAFVLFTQSLEESAQNGLYNSFADKHKTKDKKRVNELLKEGFDSLQSYVDQLTAFIDEGDTDAIKAFEDECLPEEWGYITAMLDPQHAHELEAA